MTTNTIKFDNNNFKKATGEGQISTLKADIKILAVPFESRNKKAPTHRLFGFSPAGHKLDIGGIWEKTNADGGKYFTLTIKELKFNANLGKAPYQDDTTLQAIIPWEDRVAA